MKTKIDTKIMLDTINDSNRIRIIELLSRNEQLCVCDIFERLGLPQNLTSYHLNILRKSGLVESKKEGVKVIYKLNKVKVGNFKRKINKILR